MDDKYGVVCETHRLIIGRNMDLLTAERLLCRTVAQGSDAYLIPNADVPNYLAQAYAAWDVKPVEGK